MLSGGSDSLSDAVRLLSLRRPATTATKAPELPRDSSAAAALATPRHPHKDDASLRPRAPIHPQHKAGKRQAAEDKRNISELWKSLNDFSRRSREDGDSDTADSYYNESNCSEVHFLNIDKSKSSRFVIPELPTGQVVKVNILSTWGDPHLLGLMGLEIFDDRGVLVTHTRTKIFADPQSSDHAVENLFDGVNHTCDDRHAWLAPFTQGRDHTLVIELDRPCTIAVIRVWNYNKSRPHASRGARYVEMFLDGSPIYKGELRRALGQCASSSRDCCDSILFTRSRSVLDTIEARDRCMGSREQQGEEEQQQQQQQQQGIFSRGSFCLADERPASSGGLRPSTSVLARRRQPVLCRRVEVAIRSNWGDLSAVGLSRLTAVGADLQDLSLPPLQALHWASVDSCGAVSLQRELPLPRLGLDEGPLLVTYPEQGARRIGGAVVLKFDFGARVALKGLKVWNYCDDGEGAFMGAKHVTVYVDGVAALNSIVRKAPGERRFDYHQFLPLNSLAAAPDAGSQGACGDTEGDEEEGAGEETILFFNGPSADPGVATGPRCCEELQQYETPVHPTGSLLKIVILRNHGDRGLVSIDGLLLYDGGGWPIFVDDDMIKASPFAYVSSPAQRSRARGFEAVCLEGWAAPLAARSTLYVLFEEPVTLSLVKIFNCSRRPDRGARDIELYIDDEVVFKGSLNAAPAQACGEGLVHLFYDTRGAADGGCHQSVLFTNDPEICERERGSIPEVEEEMLFLDGGSVAVSEWEETTYR